MITVTDLEIKFKSRSDLNEFEKECGVAAESIMNSVKNGYVTTFFPHTDDESIRLLETFISWRNMGKCQEYRAVRCWIDLELALSLLKAKL